MAGEIFKTRRKDLGLEIRNISERLRINSDYLVAIEEDDFEKLPAPVYTVGYLKSYAAFLGIEAEPVLEFYKSHLEQPKTAALIPVGYSKRKTPKVIYLIPFLFLGLIVMVAKPYLTKERLASPQVAPVPQPLPTATPLPTAPPVAAMPGPSVAPGVAPSAPSPLKPAEKPKTPESKRVSGAHTLSVTAHEKTWMSIKFSNGKKEEILLRAGDEKTWTFDEMAFLRLGNAGGVTMNLDGKNLGTPGASGEVATVSLPR